MVHDSTLTKHFADLTFTWRFETDVRECGPSSARIGTFVLYPHTVSVFSLPKSFLECVHEMISRGADPNRNPPNHTKVERKTILDRKSKDKASFFKSNPSTPESKCTKHIAAAQYSILKWSFCVASESKSTIRSQGVGKHGHLKLFGASVRHQL